MKGKSPIKRFTKPEDRRPLSSFLRFVSSPSFAQKVIKFQYEHRYVEDFRNSPAAEAIKNGTARGPAAMNAIAQTAGMNWRAMSNADKAVIFFLFSFFASILTHFFMQKYVEAANKDLAAWKIKHPKA